MDIEITEIINDVLTGKEKFEEADDKWFDYLEECLIFPFFATVRGSDNSSSMEVTSLNLYEKDESGIIVNVKWRKDYLQYALSNLEIKDDDDFNAIYLAAYSAWFEKASNKKPKKK